jgi:hypothetical protein
MKKALVLSLAVVLGLGVASFAQTLSGSWDTTISITPTPIVTLGINSELIVTYSVSGWSFSSDTVLTELGWTGQHFDVSGALGAFTLGSTLTFAPSTVTFTKWVVTGGLSLAGVTFDGTFTLFGPTTTTPGTTLKLVGAGSAGVVDVTATLNFGNTTTLACDFDWTGVSIEVDFPFCCADVISTVTFNCLGFDKATFEVKDITLPGLAWVSLDALLTFQMQTKSLVITPNFDFGVPACFTVYLSSPVAGKIFGDVTIDGIELACDIGGVSFDGISYWGTGTKPGLLKGTSYWEAYQIATTDDGCCGPFDFDITVYFLQGGAQLFDVAKIVANMSIQIATQFTFSTGISIDLAAIPAAFTSWTIGFEVTW